MPTSSLLASGGEEEEGGLVPPTEVDLEEDTEEEGEKLEPP
jgi:hypothetical protein